DSIHVGGIKAVDVSHEDKQVCSHFVGNGSEPGKIQLLGIGGEASDDHLRLVLNGQGFQFVVIDQAGFRVQAVLNGVVDLAGEVHAGTVGQVTTVGQAHTQNGIAGLEQCHEYGGVSLGAGVRLHVGVCGPKQFLGAVNGQLLGNIDHLAIT